jgi:hypothetical protein
VRRKRRTGTEQDDQPFDLGRRTGLMTDLTMTPRQPARGGCLAHPTTPQSAVIIPPRIHRPVEYNIHFPEDMI